MITSRKNIFVLLLGVLLFSFPFVLATTNFFTVVDTNTNTLSIKLNTDVNIDNVEIVMLSIPTVTFGKGALGSGFSGTVYNLPDGSLKLMATLTSSKKGNDLLLATIPFTPLQDGSITFSFKSVYAGDGFSDVSSTYSPTSVSVKKSIGSSSSSSGGSPGTNPDTPAVGEDCTTIGISTTDKAFYCDGSTWMQCTDEPKFAGKIFDKVKCVNKVWTQCFNKFCPSEIKKFGKTNSNQGTSPSTATDVANNTLLLGDISSVGSKIFYFKYKQKNYYVELKSYDGYEGKAELQVKSLVDGMVKGVLSLSMTENSPTLFPPTQLTLKLDNDEIYILSTGAFLNNNGQPGELQLAVLVEPTLNFDVFTESDVFLAPLQSQKLIFNGVHTISASVVGSDNVLFIDGKEYVNQGVHYFDAKKTQFINFKYAGGNKLVAQFHLSKMSQGLVESYEDTFTQEKAVEGVKICTPDLASVYTLKVCDNKEKNIFNLNDKTVYVNQTAYPNKLVWYTAPDAKSNVSKDGKVFLLLSGLTQNKNNQDGLTFTNNMVLGKRLALEVDGTYYLLSHPQTKYMDLKQLKLIDISNKNQAQYNAEGNQEEIVFNLPLGKQVNIKLNLDSALGYDISARTSVKNVVDLSTALQTQFSTYGAVTLITPNFGEIKVSNGDIQTYMDTIKIEGINELVELNYSKPIIASIFHQDILLIYDTITNAGTNTFNKYVNVYLYYDLTQKDAEHALTDTEFILPLVKGAHLALSIEGNYYLLGYSEQWDPLSPVGFTLNKLQLTKLGSSEVYPAEKNSDGVQFTVNGRIISVRIDSLNKKIFFSGKTAVDTAKTDFKPAEDYYTELPVSDVLAKQINVLGIGSNKYYNCDNKATKNYLTYFVMCLNDESEKEQINVSSPVEKSSGGDKFLIWFRGKEGSKKKITFQNVVLLNSSQNKQSFVSDTLIGNFVKKKYPVVKLENKFYEFMGGADMSSYVFKSVPAGDQYNILMLSLEDGKNKGVIAVKNDLVSFEEISDNDFNVKISMNYLPEKLFSAEAFNLTGKPNLYFTTQINSTIYLIQLSKSKEKMVDVLVKTKEFNENGIYTDLLYQGSLPEKGSTDILLTNGDVITLKVMNVTTPMVVITQ